IGFILKLPEDFGERRVTNMLRKFVILEHPGDIQSFDIDGLVLADRRSRELVNVVGANVPNPGVLFGDFDSLLVSIVRAFDLARKATLSQPKSLCGFLQWARILKCFAVAANGKGFDADINSNVGRSLRPRLNVGFDKNADEISFGFVFA